MGEAEGGSIGTLYGLAYSPWTVKALFALDHHGARYRYVEHEILLGELRLRRASRSRRPSVPLLVTADGPVMGSEAIARHVDRVGGGARLFPPEAEADISRWCARSEAVLAVARACLLDALAASPEALAESLPPFVPGPLRPALRPRLGCAFIAKKHGVASAADALDREVLPVLAELDAALAGGRDTILDGFTFADVAMACALGGLGPTLHEPGVAKLGPATRACWTRPRVVEAYPALFAWRDRVYSAYRKPRAE